MPRGRTAVAQTFLRGIFGEVLKTEIALERAPEGEKWAFDWTNRDEKIGAPDGGVEGAPEGAQTAARTPNPDAQKLSLCSFVAPQCCMLHVA